MEVQVRDQNTGKVITIPKRMYENQRNGHPEWLLVTQDIRNPLKPTPLQEVEDHLAKARGGTTGCCKDEPKADCKQDECCKDSEFIALCRKVENLGYTAEAMEYLGSLLPEEKEPEAEPEPKEAKQPKQQRKAPQKSVKVKKRI